MENHIARPFEYPPDKFNSFRERKFWRGEREKDLRVFEWIQF